MSDVKRYRVLAARSICQAGRWLEPGELVEMEAHIALAEFAGRLENEDGVRVLPPRHEQREFAAAIIAAPVKTRRGMVDARIKDLTARLKKENDPLLREEIDQLKTQSDEDLAAY